MKLPRSTARRGASTAWAAAVLVAVLGCATAEPTASLGVNPCPTGQTAVALSACSKPKQSNDYYVDQGMRYFDALDRSAPAERAPIYAELVARWEWPPWLKLTGYTKTQMDATDKLVKAQAPAVVSHRDCRAFGSQPFARCRVSFDYDKLGNGKGCRIYEEFTFNDAGEITFIEAWSDAPGYLPTTDPKDPWAQGPKVHRMSTRLPGLGSTTGRLALDTPEMQTAGQADAEVADLVARTKNFWAAWAKENASGGDYFKVGCGW